MSERLSKENLEYVLPALTNLGEQVREQGETALLSLGDILQEIIILTPRAKSVCEQEAEEVFAEQKKAREVIQ